MTPDEKRLYQKINKQLSKENQKLRKARGQRVLLNLGEYYIIDINTNAVVAQHISLEDLAKELNIS